MAKSIRIRKEATTAGIAAELVGLLETITSDGVITDAEIYRLREWIEQNRYCTDLPAVDFLDVTISHILADGRVTDLKRREVYRVVERVLPTELQQDLLRERLDMSPVTRLRISLRFWIRAISRLHGAQRF